jgi:hypothetical protein
MAMGRVKHKSSKVAKAYYREGARANSAGVHVNRRMVVIEVGVNRMGFHPGPGAARKGYYEARACVRKKSSRSKPTVSRCGVLTWGSTPTAAAKKALSSLVKKLK